MKQLILLGGGHSHALVLNHWRRRRLREVNLTLVSDVRYGPYSGMLPGYLGGFYAYDETHLDLLALAESAGAELILDRAVGLDAQARCLTLSGGRRLDFDLLSLDIGSTPALDEIAGQEAITPAKPVPQFLQAWERFLTEPGPVAIIGAGIGGIELALNIEARLRREGILKPEIFLFHRGPRLLDGYPPPVGAFLLDLLRSRGVRISLNAAVTAVTERRLLSAQGEFGPFAWVIGVTQSQAPGWLKTSGLETDAGGFIAVNAYLQSLSHPRIFAAGDIASLSLRPLPKAGVFAVRQGLPLARNLENALQQRPLRPYRPQRRYLSLIGAGDQRALALWGACWGYSPLYWRWKEYLDRRFMAQFPRTTAPVLGQQNFAISEDNAQELENIPAEDDSTSIVPPVALQSDPRSGGF
ncbi:MAG: FAD-dependent oxidoreductase [Cyanobacteria bacterium RI_101]|nr:FAD-dependent oxidoreductase [Cyanobacteria bacterium RI_101]